MLKFSDIKKEELLQSSAAAKPQIQTISRRDIAVIGMAGQFPWADTVEEFWDILCNGAECNGEFIGQRKKDTDDFLHWQAREHKDIQYSKYAYLREIDKFDYNFFNISPKEAALMDPKQRLFLQVAWKVLEDAGYGSSRMVGSNTGVYLGYSVEFDYEYKQMIDFIDPDQRKFYIAGNMKAMIASRISYLMNFKGPSMLIDTTCSSSLVALHLACQALRNQECDTAMVGAVKLEYLPEYTDEAAIGISSADGVTRTFSNDSDGPGSGEGAAAVLLKPLNKAIDDGDHIYAVIKGSAINQDGASNGITAPNPLAQEEVIIKAWKDARIEPETICYIEAHGTATRLGDPIEIEAITRSFRRFTDRKQFCAIGAIKTNIGHLDDAAGIMGLIKGIMVLKKRKIPPLQHFKSPNRVIDFIDSPVYINKQLTDLTPSEVPLRCGVSSFGMSGTNCHVVLEEAPKRKEYTSANGGKLDRIFTISAKSMESFVRLIREYTDYLKDAEDADWNNICYTNVCGRNHYEYRLACKADSICSLLDKLESVDIYNIHTDYKAGIYYGYFTSAPKIGGNDQSEDITEAERIKLTLLAAEVMEEYIKNSTSQPDLLDQICDYYVRGAALDWDRFYSQTYKRRVPLPTYSFSKTRCWMNIPALNFEHDFQKTVNDEASSLKFRHSDISNLCLTGKADGETYNEKEKSIAQAWAEVLGVNEVNIYSPFYDLGGNSLLEIKLEIELSKIGIHKTGNTSYQNLSVHQLANHSSDADNNSHSMESITTIKPEDWDQRDSVILSGMEPFNDVFYISCLYNALFSIIRYFGQDVITFLIDDCPVYRLHPNDTNPYLLMTNQRTIPIENVLESQGISVLKKERSKSIVQDVIVAVEKKHPVIIWIDCFYESIRTDLYQKAHHSHTILVYGVNHSEKHFNIIEHLHKDNLSYQQLTISFDDLENSYNGYLVHYECEDASYYEFEYQARQIQPLTQEARLEAFVDNIKNNENDIRDSLLILRRYAADFEAAVNTAFINNHLESLIEGLNQIINCKYVERYKLSLLVEETAECRTVLEQIISNYSIIRTKLAYYFYSERKKKLDINDLAQKMMSIFELEVQYYKTLIQKDIV